MSGTTEHRLSRRQFLHGAMALAGGIATFGPQEVLASDRSDSAHWAFLSDTHISRNSRNRYRGFYPYQNLQEITGQLNSSLPDGVIITGDLARLRGRSGDYQNLKKLLTPVAQKRPIHLATGNHDNRDNFLNTFQNTGSHEWRVGGKRIVTVKTSSVNLILLDSLLFVDLPWGRLGQAQRKWLKTYLEVCDETPTILCLHHPVKGFGSLLDGDSLLKVIKPMPKIKAVVHGHSHEFAFRQIDGIHMISLPATGYNQLSREPVGWVDAHLTDTEGVFTLNAVAGNTRQHGHTERLRWRT